MMFKLVLLSAFFAGGCSSSTSTPAEIAALQEVVDGEADTGSGTGQGAGGETGLGSTGACSGDTGSGSDEGDTGEGSGDDAPAHRYFIVRNEFASVPDSTSLSFQAPSIAPEAQAVTEEEYASRKALLEAGILDTDFSEVVSAENSTLTENLFTDSTMLSQGAHQFGSMPFIHFPKRWCANPTANIRIRLANLDLHVIYRS